MIILCTHNKGGVGKTTLAVHVAGVLLNRGDSVLLVDCDDQADLWQFFARDESSPNQYDSYSLVDSGSSTVIYNEERKSVKKQAQSYSHIVLDIKSPKSDTVRAIVGNDPDLILIPVNTSQRERAIKQLPNMLDLISQLRSTAGYMAQVSIVPLGIPRELVERELSQIKAEKKNQFWQIALPMEELQDEIQTAIYQERQYIWEYENHENLYEYFSDLLNIDSIERV
ncbi:MAG: ParA family protein [Limnospira sp. PMC 1291.21]|uniref:ParA family protein n=1 Tax=Limnospira TaxID=2596745 RepID=UPI00061AD8E5|nr:MULTISPECIES: ParA family protein [Limnospira]MDC0839710.1 ParA family protein [Limnoraphis robusta]MDT9177658.1 ParA family protein [Limnospira sp. PMC 1238.20]MDT9192973.1 ParA family protein [Limnospira sp. PMC 1245.20]MDT9203286.1 ParA family protein [Limnospira sp. PMC 1243.20]MDT9208486.1 ParA family protein [Limnospira sp. PMC 1252.20]